jgi:hypothetical protein
MLRSSKWSLSLRFSHQNPLYTSPLPLRYHILLHRVLLCRTAFECALQVPSKVPKYIRIAGIQDEILTPERSECKPQGRATVWQRWILHI